jgi:hypothetical protein
VVSARALIELHRSLTCCMRASRAYCRREHFRCEVEQPCVADGVAVSSSILPGRHEPERGHAIHDPRQSPPEWHTPVRHSTCKDLRPRANPRMNVLPLRIPAACSLAHVFRKCMIHPRIPFVHSPSFLSPVRENRVFCPTSNYLCALDGHYRARVRAATIQPQNTEETPWNILLVPAVASRHAVKPPLLPALGDQAPRGRIGIDAERNNVVSLLLPDVPGQPMGREGAGMTLHLMIALPKIGFVLRGAALRPGRPGRPNARSAGFGLPPWRSASTRRLQRYRSRA